VLDGWEARIVDAKGNEAAPGEPGELIVRGKVPGLITDGYIGMKGATREAIRDGWFHTGDILKRDGDGFFYFVGRRKDMVRRRGDNISSAEVEFVIEAHPDVLECAVYGVPSELTEEEVMVAVVLRPGSTLSATGLWHYCEEKLPRFMVPRYIRFLPALPKTPTDKVEKFRLAAEGQPAGAFDRERPLPANGESS
jgi:crotonobetaine/carnitine-CoA ligase